LKSLKFFGEVYVRTVRKGHQDKLENKGDLCLMIGYPKDHYHDTFRLFNLDTRKVVESRDVRWLNKMFREEGEETNLVAITSDPNEPKTFHQAWNHKDLTEKDGWRSAIQTELANMEKRNVWQMIDQSMMPKERKVIGCRRVFKKKKEWGPQGKTCSSGLFPSARGGFFRKFCTCY
jgi:hypothetical protein